jgi:threonine dehydrogenase-like Zn-dependent dehydrogenase
VKAAVLAEVGTLALHERPEPRPEAAEDVVLDVEACGICGTDLQILSVPPGHAASRGVVLGHEFVGVVSDAGDAVDSVRPGDRVAVAPNVACGRCAWCRRGLRNQCERFETYGITRDGGLAHSVRVAASACHPIGGEVPAHMAALVEPLSTVVHGAHLAAVFPGDLAVVLGAGPVGLMFTALLRLGGASVISVEPAQARTALAERMGADRVVRPPDEDAAAVVDGATAGLGADVVVDAVGTQLPAALRLVRPGGRVVLFGFDERARADVRQAEITRNEVTILGSFVGENVFPTAVRLLEQGRLDLAPLVTHRIGLDELPEAIDELRAGRAVKVEVEFA